MISIVMPHAINLENDKVLRLNQKMIEENTANPFEILTLGNTRRKDLVYEGWNYLIKAAKYELILWTNTDLLLAPEWDKNILGLSEIYDWISLRVVECGAIGSADTMISKDFGMKAATFKRKAFENFVKEDYSTRSEHQTGWVWYCPSIIKRSKFIELGGFDTTHTFPHPNDVEFKHRAEKAGWRFGVSNHSYAYHLQRAQENLEEKEER